MCVDELCSRDAVGSALLFSCALCRSKTTCETVTANTNECTNTLLSHWYSTLVSVSHCLCRYQTKLLTQKMYVYTVRVRREGGGGRADAPVLGTDMSEYMTFSISFFKKKVLFVFCVHNSLSGTIIFVYL